MSGKENISTECLAPILYVGDFQKDVDYYTNNLLFKLQWDWGDPPSFGCVRPDEVEIFFCLNEQGRSSTWMSIFMDEVANLAGRSGEAATLLLGETCQPLIHHCTSHLA